MRFKQSHFKMLTHSYTTVLTIAGSDSGGGAGIQADLKTFAAFGCYGTSAITAITAQNTLGITEIHTVPAGVVGAQIRAVLEDIGAGAIKMGMICSEEQVWEVREALIAPAASAGRESPTARVLRKALIAPAGRASPTARAESGAPAAARPFILDPVLVSTSGTPLISLNVLSTLRENIFPLTSLITPNLPEAEVLCGFPVREMEDMRRAAHHLLQTGAGAILIKGGHLAGDRIRDLYVNKAGQELVFESDRIESPNLHGTGCTLSAAIAACLALGNTIGDSFGDTMEKAIARARVYVLQAIETGKHIRTGHGQGPLNHAPLRENALRSYCPTTNT